jgi:hypothetical protein
MLFCVLLIDLAARRIPLRVRADKPHIEQNKSAFG